jgi:3-hydroxyacyl-CoA dehydrogenase
MTPTTHRNQLLRLAVVGTGTMGSAMASRLLAAGMEVDVWSRHRASTQSLVEQGAKGVRERRRCSRGCGRGHHHAPHGRGHQHCHARREGA